MPRRIIYDSINYEFKNENMAMRPFQGREHIIRRFWRTGTFLWNLDAFLFASHEMKFNIQKEMHEQTKTELVFS